MATKKRGPILRVVSAKISKIGHYLTLPVASVTRSKSGHNLTLRVAFVKLVKMQPDRILPVGCGRKTSNDEANNQSRIEANR